MREFEIRGIDSKQINSAATPPFYFHEETINSESLSGYKFGIVNK